MSTPLRFITLTGTCTRGAGPDPAVGYIRVGARSTTEAPGANVVLTAQPSPSVALDEEGRFSVQVTVADDPGLSAPVLLEVLFLLEGTRPEMRTYHVLSDADTVDIADLYPIDVNVQPRPLVVTWDAVGAIGGVASLDQDGKIPVSQLPDWLVP